MKGYASLSGVPLAVTPEYAAALQDLVEFTSLGVALTDDEVSARLDRVATPGRAAATTAGGVGVIAINGVIGPASAGWDVDATVERIGAEFAALLRDERVGTIVLNIDSPGGMVYGTPELAQRIAAGRAQKRIVAYTGGMMASAAYWLGSAAHEIVAAPSAQAGSIGVFTIHADVSRRLENDGIHVSLIKAGANKAEGNPFAPLTDSDRAAIQSRIDDYYDQFVTAVASHRGITAAAVRAGYGTGRVLNARQAHVEGVVDRVMTFDALLTELAGTTSRATAFAAVLDSSAALAAAPVPPVTAVAAVVTPPAITARSIPVTENATAAPSAAIADTREKDIRALAKAHGKDLAWLDATIESGASVADVQRAILASYQQQHASTSVTSGSAVIAVGEDRATKKPWANFADQIAAVVNAGTPGVTIETMDPRLKPLAAATGMSQGVPADGGFLVAPQFSSGIWDGLNNAPESLLARTDNYTVTGESLTFNANAETSRATGSRYGGLRAYWINEADQITKSKPTFRQLKLEPNGLAALVYLTDKLLRNSPVALEQYLSRAVPEEIGFVVGDAIFAGDGVGKPKGYFTSGAKVTVAKETSQAAATVNQINISKMWARLHPRARANAVWLHNVDVEPQLDALSTVVQNVAGTENVGGYANKVFDAERRTLKGRPLVACEFCSTLGTDGDLVLADLSSYATGTRGGIETAMSMHVRFEYMEQALRFYFEVDGQSWLASALTPFKGSNTLTTIVSLATRS